VEIVLNGEPRTVDPDVTVGTLLRALDLDARQVAVERNREIVPRVRYDATALAAGDVLEIVTFVGGG
jgi:thiamine biosynthesis protein ThiS